MEKIFKSVLELQKKKKKLKIYQWEIFLKVC